MTAPVRPPWASGLATAVAGAAGLTDWASLRPAVGARAAAVLILVADGSAGPEILFVERAATMRTHAGQIAFPGGAVDPSDADLAATALREAQEETGLDPTGVEVLGALPPAHVAVSGFDVTAVVGWWHTPSPVGVADPREVAAVHILGAAELVRPAFRASVRHPSGYTGPAFEVRGLLIWGLTAHLLDGLLQLAGWDEPWDRHRLVSIPERYLRDRRRTGGRTDLGGHDAH
ncbi:MAG: NUDIX hydrolase [Actinomycetes bacterium]